MLAQFITVGVIRSGAVFQAERRISRTQDSLAWEIPRPAGESAGLRDDAQEGGYEAKAAINTE